MDIKGDLAKMPFYLVCFVCITRFLKPQILYKYTISAKGKRQNCIFIRFHIQEWRLFMYHSDRKTCVVAHIKYENIVRMSFLSYHIADVSNMVIHPHPQQSWSLSPPLWWGTDVLCGGSSFPDRFGWGCVQALSGEVATGGFHILKCR